MSDFIKQQSDLVILLRKAAYDHLGKLLVPEFNKLFDANPALQSFTIVCESQYYDDQDTFFKINVKCPDINGICGWQIDDEYFDDEETPANLKELQELQSKVAFVLKDLNVDLFKFVVDEAASEVSFEVTKNSIEIK